MGRKLRKRIRQINVTVFSSDWSKFLRKHSNASARLRELITLDLEGKAVNE